MSIRDQLMEATADLPTTAEMAGTAVVRPQRDPDRPKTAVGAVAALSAAKLRVQELEQQLEQRGAQGLLAVDKIRPNPWQPRIKFDALKLQELADAIAEVGLLQPVLVRQAFDENNVEYFELIAGERRLRAHKLNKMPEIKAIVTTATDADMAVFALAENISREDLTDYEVAKGMRRAEAEFPNRTRLAEAMGISRAALYRFLSFQQLPEFMQVDLEQRPELLGGTAASDIAKVLSEKGDSAIELSKEFWAQLVAGQLDQTKFAAVLDAALLRRQSGSSETPSNRDIHKVYAGKAQAGSITKDSNNFIVKLKSGMLSEAQEQRIRSLIEELYKESKPS